MAGPSVKIKVGADLSPAEAEVNKFQTELGAAAQKSGQQLADGVAKGASQASGALGGVEQAAKKTATETAKIAQSVSLGDKIGMIGAFKSIIEQSIAPMLGLSEATTKAVSKSLDLANQGANIGKAYGPLPALFGGLLGGALGIAATAIENYKGKTKSLSEAKAALELATKNNITAESNYRIEIQKNGVASIEAIQARINALKQEAKAAIEVEKAKGKPEDWRSYEMRADEVEAAFGELATKAGAAVKSTEALKKELGILPKDGLDVLEKAAGRTKAAFQEADGKVQDLQRELKGIDSRNVDLLAQKSDELAAALLEQASTGAKASEALTLWTTAVGQVPKDPPIPPAPVKESTKAVQGLSTAIQEYTVITIAAAQAGGKAQLINLEAFYSETQAKIVALNKKAKDDFDALLGDDKTAGQLKASTDKFISDLEGEKPKIQVEVEVDPSSYDAAQDKLETFASTSKRVFKDAGSDFKKAGAAFLQEAIAVSAAKVAENVEKGEKAYKGLGIAVAEAAKTQILALGKTWAFKAGGEAAESIANLAFGNVPGAILHGQAALMFGALAAAAGVGAGLIGRALPTPAESAPSSSPTNGGNATSAGASFGGGTTFQELPAAQVNLAPGGTVIFAGDTRGRAEYGRFNQDSEKFGQKGRPGK